MPRDKPADRFPDDVVAYRRTPEFDAATTPPGLLGEHNTSIASQIPDARRPSVC